jgi:hypothetical protein
MGMNLTNIIVGAVGGLVAGLIAQLVMKRLGKQSPAVYAVAFAIAFAIISAASREYVHPQLAAASAETELLKRPVYQALRDNEPVAYQEIVRKLKGRILDKTPNAELFAQTRPLLSPSQRGDYQMRRTTSFARR